MFKVIELNNQLQYYCFLLYDANSKDVVFNYFSFLQRNKYNNFQFMQGNSGQALPVK